MTQISNERCTGSRETRTWRDLGRAAAILLLGVLISSCSVSNEDLDKPKIGKPGGGTISRPAGGEISEPSGGQVRGGRSDEELRMKEGNPETAKGGADDQLATFGAGCFWCVEAVLEQLDGVVDVTSGYMGGTVEDPTYEQVCSGRTGHAEVVQVLFDPAVISYEALLEWFWKLHDPTTLNRQGADRGTQYRSAIFYHTEAQRDAAEASKKKADASGAFSDPIVTEITAAGPYYIAEQKHQDFYRDNRRHRYCRAVIAPKLDKLGLEK